MMPDGKPLTPTDILASASEILAENGYSQVPETVRGQWPAQSARLFEDPYGIVAVVTYDTWRDLVSSWAEVQTSFVELVSKYVTSSEAKAWEGYLILLTPSILTSDGYSEAERIRYDTSRVRKILATGDELKGLADVEQVLMPLLPLREVALGREESSLDVLPELLSRRDIPVESARVIVRAFVEQQPLMERLHGYLART